MPDMNEKQIRQYLEALTKINPSAESTDRALNSVRCILAPDEKIGPETRTDQLSIWRIIMKSKITKFAAAAAVILAAFLAINFLDKTSGVVWASVVERLENIKTVTYQIRSDIKGMPGVPEEKITHVVQDVMLSYEKGVKIDSTIQLPRGTRTMHSYVDFIDGVIITLMPDQKRYAEVKISDEQMQKSDNESGDPLTLLKAMLQHEYTELGRNTIDGITVWGIEVSDPKLGVKMGSLISGGMFDETIVQLWVDEKTQLPLKVTASGSSSDGQTSMDLVIDGFQWDPPIDESLLKADIPQDYELLVQSKWDTGNEGQEIIEVLRLFVDFADGKYPSSLNTMTVTKAITPALKKSFPPGSPKPDPELVARLVKIDMVGMMYTTLQTEGKDPAYYGDKVSADTPDAVLFRWKIDDTTYRVVFGDLTTTDVTPEELAELESTLQDI